MPALVQAQNPGENGPPASCAAVAVAASVESGRFFANLPAVPRPAGIRNIKQGEKVSEDLSFFC